MNKRKAPAPKKASAAKKKKQAPAKSKAASKEATVATAAPVQAAAPSTEEDAGGTAAADPVDPAAGAGDSARPSGGAGVIGRSPAASQLASPKGLVPPAAASAAAQPDAKAQGPPEAQIPSAAPKQQPTAAPAAALPSRSAPSAGHRQSGGGAPQLKPKELPAGQKLSGLPASHKSASLWMPPAAGMKKSGARRSGTLGGGKGIIGLGGRGTAPKAGLSKRKGLKPLLKNRPSA